MTNPGPAERLRRLLAGGRIVVMPGVFDALSARLAERAGFPAAFMGGFAVSAARLGMPDTGLISYAEMLDQGAAICNAVSIPMVGDGDTGYGNALNVKRTVRGYARAGFACVMIEDQVAPKRCGHTRGKQTVSRDEACMRIRAAADARDAGSDILILARTDANATEGFDEAVARCRAFRQAGADITFMEAPRDEEQMRAYCAGVDGPKMANMVEQGMTPFLPPPRLQELGYAIAIYPVSLMLAGIRAMETALATLAEGKVPEGGVPFTHLQDVVGFPDYFAAERTYAVD